MVVLFFFSYFPSFLQFCKVCDCADTPAPYEMRAAKRTVVPPPLHPQNAQPGFSDQHNCQLCAQCRHRGRQNQATHPHNHHHCPGNACRLQENKDHWREGKIIVCTRYNLCTGKTQENELKHY